MQEYRIQRKMSYIIRKPDLSDGNNIYKLAQLSKPLDLNSIYSYLLICSHFDQTSAVAEKEDELVGYVSGYKHPHKDDTLFIWQVAVHPTMRGEGLATRMLKNILKREELLNINYMEATITPSNTKSRNLFKSIAVQYNTNYHESIFLECELFGEYSHEEEKLLRIGPLKPP